MEMRVSSARGRGGRGGGGVWGHGVIMRGGRAVGRARVWAVQIQVGVGFRVQGLRFRV